jgi:hypothetical protein
VVGKPEFICLIQRSIELGVSIQQDLANEALALSASGFQCGTLVEVDESSLDPDQQIENIGRLQGVLDSPPALVIYHWCDEWHEVDALLASSRAPLIVRCHHHRPARIFAPYSLIATSRMLRGYNGILKLVDSPGIRGLANSCFSARQLEIQDGV